MLFDVVRISEEVGAKLVCVKANDIDNDYDIDYFFINEGKILKYFQIDEKNGCIYLKSMINLKYKIGEEINVCF